MGSPVVTLRAIRSQVRVLRLQRDAAMVDDVLHAALKVTTLAAQVKVGSCRLARLSSVRNSPQQRRHTMAVAAL